MQAQKSEFKVGDKAVYPARGVAEVVSIEDKDIAGQRQKFYVLRLLDTDQKIYVPVQRAQGVGLRKPISDKDCREIFAILKEEPLSFDTQTWNRRYRGFMDKIRTGSVFDVAEVLRDLYRLRAEKALSYGERQMLDKARNLIVKEVAVARRRKEDRVLAQIEKIFELN
jgi:CarD family transcriptional regulator